ncbi:cobalamin-binding protein [Desulfofundulus sp. TPOSR]|uniref:corrinoid protein n=1 Tax=Desulfofundulus sp. TPOSR TaxID=2714340 RepID=UPI001407463B|nr:corrinoid protein [Desulfofundulus sp. TPOSR]NHM26483.1 cobalamin-binding protein [Desulfofundulus sp. TPOSR]
MSKYQELAQLVIDGDIQRVEAMTKKLLDAGEDPLEIINEGLIAGINEVGIRFRDGEMFVPEMMRSARAMKAGMEVLKPAIAGADIPTAGKVVIGTVKGDLHDIGKNLVIMMLESSGFNVVDLGIDVPVDKFVRAVKEHSPQVLGLSALLTTTMPVMGEVISALDKENLRGSVKVIVGGAPVSQEFADEIGADGYAPDAASAAELCKQLVN